MLIVCKYEVCQEVKGCVLVQGKAPKTVMAKIIDSIAAGMQADIPQLASDFQMGPANSVSFFLRVLLCSQPLAESACACCNTHSEQRTMYTYTCFLARKYELKQ